ncbi:MAG: hypothetical protein FD174_3257 [Geobacteraceae bacterium]|nr:MAG: hypothetical protein FD174_3257 [Geobacteraceae bacterium]
MSTFPDQVHIERIAEALWRKSPLGNAALMVGAGLSRNARNIADPNRMMPTWGDLAESLCEKLYPSSDKSITHHRSLALKKASATSGALRLAQEYEASFGRTELNRLLKTFVPDDDFAPSSLHENLLKLPWADVFTTNWDTLLEKALDSIVDRRYDVVLSREDIPASQQPRIVKLHGSFPSNYPFIFTEEDYRSYPTQFPYFVNMVQQTMMENLFCLVGFSGDDPNFLHWAGWVRDNLGKSAPKIYMVGWLDLAPVQRRVLEDRNIIPVDLSKLPQATKWPEEFRHRYALEWFQWTLKVKQPTASSTESFFSRGKQTPPSYLEIDLDAFTKENPKERFRANTSGPGKELERLKEVQDQLPYWQNERFRYEGWVIAPRRIRSKIWLYTKEWIIDVTKVVHLMTPWERLFILREIVWRLDICLAPLFNRIHESLAQVLNDINPNERKCFKDGQEIVWPESNWTEARNAWFEVAMSLLRHYRIEGVSEEFELLAPRIEDLRGCKHTSDVVTYQRALLSIQQMNFSRAKKLVQSWQVERSDHIWAIRKAGILFELGELDTAYELLITILPAIRRSIRRDIDDYAALSREGCAMQLIEIAEWEKRHSRADSQEDQSYNNVNNPDWAARWKTLMAKDCDIRDEWQGICAQLNAPVPDPRPNKEIRKRRFDLGQESTSRHYGSGDQFLPALQALAFTEAAGMPTRIMADVVGVSVGSSGLRKAAEWLKLVEPEIAFKLILRVCTSESDDTLNLVSTRETVAQLNSNFVEETINILLQSANEIAQTISADKKYSSNLRVAMELLSRLALRLTDHSKQKQVFDLAISLTHNLAISGHLWLAGALSNLLIRSIECFEMNAQKDLVLPLLKLPTEGVEARTFCEEPWWGDFLNNQDEGFRLLRDSEPAVWSDTVRHLLSMAAKKESRQRAVLRLAFLHDRNLLSEQEQQEFAKTLWSADYPSATRLPGETNFYPWVFLTMPCPEEGMAERCIRTAYLTKEGAEKLSLADYLKDLGNILDVVRERKLPFLISQEEAVVIATKIVAWSKESYTPSTHPFANVGAEKEICKVIGVAKLLPFVALEDMDFLNIKNRIDILEQNQISCYRLYPLLIAHCPELANDLINRLKVGISGYDTDAAISVINAIYFWLSLAETGHAALPPDNLLEEVGLVICMRREPVLASALRFAAYLIEKQPDLSKRTIFERSIMGLQFLIDACRYEAASLSGLAERIDIPLIRYYCTQLAFVISKHGYEDQVGVRRWTDAAKDDPLPEVRKLVA